MVAFGGIIIPKVNLILSLICREYYSSQSPNPISIADIGLGNDIDPMCREPAVTARVSVFSLVTSLISGILSAIIAPKLGALSDRYGRRPIMMICTTGTLCGEIITIIAASIPQTFNVKWIFLGSFLDGLTGSFMASMAVSQSYATDTTAPSKRNVIFGWFHGCMNIGIALGPLISGQIVARTNNIIIMFYVALGCHLTFILLLVLVIPESLAKTHRKAAQERHEQEVDRRPPTPPMSLRRAWSTVKSVMSPLKILYPRDDPIFTPDARRNLVLLASVDAIVFGIAMGAISAVMLYSISHFNWSVATQSYFFSLVSFSRTFVLLLLLPLLAYAFRGRVRIKRASGTNLFELSMIRVAIFFDILGFVGYTFSKTGGMFMASGVITSLGGIGSPNLQAALTKHVPPDRIGQLLGAMALLHAITRVASPLIFNPLFALTVGKFDQALFVVLTALFGVAWGVSWMIKPGGKSESIP
jgi:MFS family permease